MNWRWARIIPGPKIPPLPRPMHSTALAVRMRPQHYVPPAPQSQMAAQPNAESLLWDSIKESHRSADFKTYLQKFPNGLFAELARNRLAKMSFDGVWSVKHVCS